jgi:heptosyltransferase-1
MPSILLVKTSSLGDVVHNLPVASDIRRKMPGWEVDWLVEESFADIPRLHPCVRDVIPVALRRWRRSPLSAGTWRELESWRHALRDRPYDFVLDTQGLIKSALLARLARGRHCGFAAGAAREPLAARFYDDTFVIPRNVHAVERNRWLAAAALDYAQDAPLDYGIRSDRLDADWLPPQPYAVLITATSRADKLWPDAHWLAICTGLHARGIAAVLPAGSDEERSRARRLADNGRRALAAPPLAVRELAGLMAGAGIVIGLDTGLTHLAAALGVPVVCIFSGSNPMLTGVLRDSGAINLGGPGAPPGPEEVLQAADSLLD